MRVGGAGGQRQAAEDQQAVTEESAELLQRVDAVKPRENRHAFAEEKERERNREQRAEIAFDPAQEKVGHGADAMSRFNCQNGRTAPAGELRSGQSSSACHPNEAYLFLRRSKAIFRALFAIAFTLFFLGERRGDSRAALRHQRAAAARRTLPSRPAGLQQLVFDRRRRRHA